MTSLLTRMARSADTADVLAAIRQADCNLAIWQRQPIADFEPLTEGTPPDLRFESDAAGVPALLEQGLTQSGYAGGTALHRMLIEDAATLAHLFCGALDLDRLELRLELVRTDSCRKFHADYVTTRLITTYVGEATDWLDDADADRVAAGKEPQKINRMNAFDVGLFKGKLATDRPAIHRSPPIAGTGATRLLMVLNPARKQFVDQAYSPFSRGGQVA
jgi:hypothetical protein